MIVAGESSGELYGALLATSLKKRKPDITVIGIGGERMKDAGVKIIAGITSALGLAEVISSFRAIRETFKKAEEALQRYKPCVLVLIDYPDFNLKLADKAKKNNIRILYYVSPQVWAWRRRRIKKIARLVDRMAVILPFEQELYRNAGLESEFVGHPAFDEIQNFNRKNRDEVIRELGLRADKPLLSLLPGSRPHELTKLLPVMAEILKEFKKEFHDYQYCIPFAPNTDLRQFSGVIDTLRREGVIVNQGKSLAVLSVSDYAVVASGTASLQAVFFGVPIVVVYKLFPLTYLIGRLIVKVKHISLVNILLQREVVKELLQSDVTSQNVLNELRTLMVDEVCRDRIKRAYEDVQQMFRGKKASDRVAEIIGEMAGWNR